jgi:hypothetical protein
MIVLSAIACVGLTCGLFVWPFPIGAIPTAPRTVPTTWSYGPFGFLITVNDGQYRFWVVNWPYLLLLAILCGLLPATPLRRCSRSLVRRWRRQHKLCPECGYDLRTTPDRCPECGSECRAEAKLTPAASE